MRKLLSGIIALALGFCIPAASLAETYLSIGDIQTTTPASWTEEYNTTWRKIAIALCGGVWGIVGITSALFVQDKLLALAVPFCFYYLWHRGLPGALLGIKNFPHPADLYNDALTWNMVYQSMIVYLVIALVCLILYVTKLRKRYHADA